MLNIQATAAAALQELVRQVPEAANLATRVLAGDESARDAAVEAICPLVGPSGRHDDPVFVNNRMARVYVEETARLACGAVPAKPEPAVPEAPAASGPAPAPTPGDDHLDWAGKIIQEE